MNEDKDMTLVERLKHIEHIIKYGMDEAKTKKFNMPLKIRLRQKKLAKKNKAIVIMPMKNRNLDIGIGEVRDGGIWYKGVLRNSTNGAVYLWSGKIPCVVIKEGSIAPETFDSGKDDEVAQRILIRRIWMEMARMDEELKKKEKQLSLGMIVVGIIVIGLIIYVFTGGV